MKATKRYLFPADYMADPSVHVFNGKLYIYPSHDNDDAKCENDNGDQYVMRDMHVLSTDDPMNGLVVDHGQALDIADIPWAGRQLWDCEGPSVPQPDPIRGSYSMDICVFEEDGKYYLYFGGLWGGQLQRYKDNKALENAYLPEGDEPALPSRVVRLTDDMLQFAEEPRPVLVVDEDGKPLAADDPHRFFEASWLHKYNGKYYFSYSTGDSHLLCSAIGDNPYGPFTYKGVILTPVVGWTTHHCIVEYKGKWYLFHHDAAPSGGRSWLRSLKVCELEYDENGLIKTIDGIDE